MIVDWFGRKTGTRRDEQQKQQRQEQQHHPLDPDDREHAYRPTESFNMVYSNNHLQNYSTVDKISADTRL